MRASKRWLASPERWGSHAKITSWNDRRIFLRFVEVQTCELVAMYLLQRFDYNWFGDRKKLSSHRRIVVPSINNRVSDKECVIRNVTTHSVAGGERKGGWERLPNIKDASLSAPLHNIWIMILGRVGSAESNSFTTPPVLRLKDWRTTINNIIK